MQGKTTHYLYEDGQLSAELNEQGQITRQYLYLAGQPIAVIDSPEGKALQKEELLAPASLGLDTQNILKHLWQSTIGSDGGEQTTWLHTNHLGAPEAATDASGQLIWQASYAPFGAAKIIKASTGKSNNSTSLHYNRHRYYDPSRGEYLTPDPLGTPDGPNPYAYVRYNPLKYVDPDGLVLFAFDGTDNTNDGPTNTAANSSSTNVVQFRDAYNDGNARYVTGVGRDHATATLGRDNYAPIVSRSYNSGLIPDRGGNYSGPDRIARMMLYQNEEAELADNNTRMNIDITGFSRGAAQARDFANQIVRATTNGVYRYMVQTGINPNTLLPTFATRTQCVNFRFMGLFDTVLATNRSGRVYDLGIPANFAYVAHAVALNEYRSAPSGVNAGYPAAQTNFNFWDNSRTHLTNDNHYGGFPLESIGGNTTAPGRTRVEMGFIGAHADIGGGYGATDNGLSTVALSWMVAQAQVAGVSMRAPAVGIDMNNPVIHDQSNALRWGNPTNAPAVQIGTLATRDTITPEDRQVNGASTGTTQRNMGFGAPLTGGNRSMLNADTHGFINYTARDPVTTRRVDTNDLPQIVALQNRTGTVDMSGYMSWLRGHGYVFYGDY